MSPARSTGPPRAVYGALDDDRPRARPPAVRPAGRHRRRRRAGPRPVPLAELDLDGSRGAPRRRWSRRSSAAGCSRSTATGSRSRTRRCSPPGRGSPAGWRTTPPAGRSAGTSRPAASRVGPRWPARRRAVPRRPARGRPGLGGTDRRGRHAARAGVPRRLARGGGGRARRGPRRADREAAARRRTPAAGSRSGRGARPGRWSPRSSPCVPAGGRARRRRWWPTPTGWRLSRRPPAASTSPSCSPSRPCGSRHARDPGRAARRAHEHGRAERVVPFEGVPPGCLPRRRRPHAVLRADVVRRGRSVSTRPHPRSPSTTRRDGQAGQLRISRPHRPRTR